MSGWNRRGRKSCVPRPRNCISCVTRCLLHVYQLRHKMSASCVFVMSRVVNRMRISCIEVRWYTKCPTIWRFLHSLIVFTHNYMHTYRSVEWYQQCTVVISRYCLMSKPYLKKNLFGEDDRHTMFVIWPISSYCYDLMKTLSAERVLLQ